MRTLLASFLLLSANALACEIRRESSVYSLSGPVTVLLRELDLLASPQLKGISVFHPVKEFNRDVLPGGVFLAHSLLKKLHGHVVFFDESQQLRKTFEAEKKIRALEVKTRGLDPKQVTHAGLSLLRPHLKNCEGKIKQLLEVEEKRLARLLTLASKQRAVFFLGRITDRLPDLVMANDGVVKWLVQQQKLTTYPTELAYVSWSAKVLEGLPAGSRLIGLTDSTNRDEKKIERAEKGWNLTYPGVLIPGLSQVDGFIYLFEAISLQP